MLAIKLVPRSNIPKPLRGIERRRHDRHIAAAATDVARQKFAQRLLAGIGHLAQIPVERHQNAGRAEPALQRVVAAEGFLQYGEASRLRRKTLDGPDARAIGLNGQRETRARRRAVDLNRAGAANTVLATDMRAGEAERVTQEVGEQHARLGLAFDGAAVDLEAHRVARIGAQTRHACASSIAARPSLRTSPRRYSAVACKSSRASNSEANAASASSLTCSNSRTIGRSPTPPMASRTLLSVATAAQATMAKSPWRRANSRNANPSPRRRQGNDTASISSSSLRAVDISPMKNSSAFTLRRPALDDKTTSPPSAASTSGSSALGSASATEPHTVPLARVCQCPTQGSAALSSG